MCVRARPVCIIMLHMYLDFHVLYLPLFPWVLFCFHFGANVGSPRFRSLATQTWGASSTRPFTTPRQPLTTPRTLLTPALSIAPHPRESFGILRPRRRSRA